MTGKITSLLILIALLLWGVACSDDAAEESVAAKQLKQLAGEWKAESVTFDGEVQEGYADFTLRITISGETALYVVTGAPERTPWLLSGTLTPHENHPEDQLVREDEVPISYDISANVLVMNFVYIDVTEGGHSKSVAGNWSFTLKKK